MRNPIEWLLGVPSQEEVDAVIAAWEAKTHHVPDDADITATCRNCGEPIHHNPKYDFWSHSAVRIGTFCNGYTGLVPTHAEPVDAN